METIEKLKSEIYAKIEEMDDETALHLVREAITEYTSAPGKDILDKLTPSQRQRLQESIQQADQGKTVTNEEVKQIARSCLLK